MGCLTGAAFWAANISVTFMVFSFLAPFWLGRRETDVTNFYGLWYNLECFDSSCTLFSDVFDSATIPLRSRFWDFDIVVIPVLVTIGLAFGVIVSALLEYLRCRRGGHSYSSYEDLKKIKIVLGVCAILLFVSSIANAIATFISFYVADEYYKDNVINHASEFPWCILSIVIATILAFISAILYTIIVCNWYKYSDHYDYSRYSNSSNDEPLHGGYYKSNSRYSSSFRESKRDSPKQSSYSVPAFSGPPLALSRSHGLSSSMYGRSTGNGLGKSVLGKSKLAGENYLDYRNSRYLQSLNNSPRQSTSDLRASRISIHDSPRIMRSTKMSDYVQEHDDYITRLRESRRQEETIDPYRLSTAVTPYRQSREDEFTNYSGSRSSTTQPTVLDILYRESRKNTHL